MKRVVKPESVSGQRADRQALAEVNDLIDDGIYDAASVLAWEIQRETPGDPAVWLLLARIDYLRERYAAAMYAARMATRLDPSSAAAWFALASTAVTRSRWRAEGLDAALQATALAPGSAKHWTVLAQLQLAGGEQYEAAVAAERAVRVDPAYRGGHLMLGEIALDAGEWGHAEAAFRTALELDPSDRDARDGLVEALEAQGRDPAEEFAADGRTATPAPAERRAMTAARALPDRRSDRGARRWGPPLPVVIAGALAAGLLLGTVAPGIGVVRGLVGAVAVILMWVAVRPTRSTDGAAGTTGQDRPAQPDSAGGGDPRRMGASGDLEDERSPSSAAAVAGDGPVEADEGSRRPGGSVVTPPPHDPSADGVGRVPAELAQPGDERRAAERTDLRADVEQQVDAEQAVDGEAEQAVDVRPPDAEPDTDPAAHPAVALDIPDDPAELAELSRARLAAADLELAHAAASRLEAVAPGSLEAHRALGAVALAERDYAQARLHYGQVLEIEPLDQEAHERLALAVEGLQRSTFRRSRRRLRGRR